MNNRTDDYKTIITFWDTQSVPKLTGYGGMTEQIVNPRQEYGSLNPMNPTTLINAQNEDIRKSTHILYTRFRTDISSFTTVTRECLSSDYTTTYTEQFKVNDIQLVGQENRYIISHLTLEKTSIQTPSNTGAIVTAGQTGSIANVVTTDTTQVTAGATDED